MAFTYYIAWSQQNLHYYGVRYKPGSTPSDLWTSYFTSSKIVAKMRELFGEPDVIQVRREFDDPAAAMLWEKRVLIRLGVRSRSDWLNDSCGGHIGCPTPEMLAKAAETKLRNGTTNAGNLPEYRTPVRYEKAKTTEVATKRAKGQYAATAAKIAAINEQNGHYNRTCPHCGKAGRVPGMFRWHFDNCQMRSSNSP